MTTLGAAGATKIQRTQRISSNAQIVDVYDMDPSKLATFVSGYTVGTSTIGSLVLATIDQQIKGGKATATLTFVPPSTLTAKYAGTSVTTYDSDTNATETPIWQHPDCDNPDGWKTEENPIIDGVEQSGNLQAYLTPAPTFTRTRSVNAATLSQSDVIGDVGKIEAPTGLTSPTAGRWLNVAKNITNNGEVMTIRETWQYNPEGVWNDKVYG